MTIVVATAEPYAAYHLQYFSEEQAEHLVHLVPDVNQLQGFSKVTAVDDISVLSDAALIVVTGGLLTDWTRFVGLLGNRLGIPVVFSEFAYTARTVKGEADPVFVGVSVASPYSLMNLKEYVLEGEVQVKITGYPMLDSVPSVERNDKRVLILSSVSQADGGVALKACASRLSEAGFNVVVRPHPREDVSLWDGFELSDVDSIVEDLALSKSVVGVPGTAFAAAAVLRVPIVAVEGSAAADVLPLYRLIFQYVTSLNVFEALNGIEPLSDDMVFFIAGPNGSASSRILSFWESFKASTVAKSFPKDLFGRVWSDVSQEGGFL